MKRYDRAGEPGRLQRAPQYRPGLVGPYRDYLRKRRAGEPGVPVQQLLREIREKGYPGSSSLLVRYINQGRPDTGRPHIAPRKATQILLTDPQNLSGGQRETASRLAAACPEMKILSRLTGKFALISAGVEPLVLAGEVEAPLCSDTDYVQCRGDRGLMGGFEVAGVA